MLIESPKQGVALQTNGEETFLKYRGTYDKYFKTRGEAER